MTALADDIRCGSLAPGERLPPQRELAYRLGVGVGTISRAYVEAERSGLVTSHVGRGTFVAERKAAPIAQRRREGPVDLARNVPPLGPALRHLDAALEALRRREDVGAIVDYGSTSGAEAVLRAGAAWLTKHGRISRASPERLIQTSGGQHGLMLACSLAGAGGTILCDRATYPGNLAIAAFGGWKLHGVAADERGMEPGALDRAAAETGARLLLLIPTLHNPTAVTLDASRREEIVQVARARDLIIVEDDVYRVFGRPEDPAPLAELAPERTVFVTSLSKALAPGLRLGFLLPPEDQAIAERLLLGAQATAYCPPAAGGLIFAQWMDDGLADLILDEVRAEVHARYLIAEKILGTAVDKPGSEHSLHVWLPMEAARAERLAAAALRAGVEVTPPAAPFVDSSAVCGVRLCQGAATDREQLNYVLGVVSSALADGNVARARAIV